MHTPYKHSLERQPDFVVEYEINLCKELNNAKPHQGMRTDFLYYGDDPQTQGAYMIWPGFLDEKGLPIDDTTHANVPKVGKANMWIVSENMREYHRNRLKVGTKGFWVCGPCKVATVVVVKLGDISC